MEAYEYHSRLDNALNLIKDRIVNAATSREYDIVGKLVEEYYEVLHLMWPDDAPVVKLPDVKGQYLNWILLGGPHPNFEENTVLNG